MDLRKENELGHAGDIKGPARLSGPWGLIRPKVNGSHSRDINYALCLTEISYGRKKFAYTDEAPRMQATGPNKYKMKFNKS